MSATRTFGLRAVSGLTHRIAMIGLAAVALGLTGYAITSAFGLTPWPEIPVAFNGQPIAHAGIYATLALTGFSILSLSYLPATSRVLRLEDSHRDFHLSMLDVVRAYKAAHQADREGAFALSTEFDEVRDRIAFLRAHPDLKALEPDVLELAAQMSQTSQDLAERYSEEKVTRARAFLTQRQQEVDDMTARLDRALTLTQELRFWLQDVEQSEAQATQKLDQLSEELSELLPELHDSFPELDPKKRPTRVVDLRKAAE